MRTQYRLRNTFIWVLVVILILSVLTSIIYLKNSDSIAWSIINNIMICILTGCIIGCIQASVGYINEKRATILRFYKEAIMLEDAIINYPFMRTGYIESCEGLKDIRIITHQYMDNFKFSKQCVYVGKNPDAVLSAVIELFHLYSEQIKVFRKMEDALQEALRFSDKSDDDLLAEGIVNIPKENESINRRLQAIEQGIAQAYNAKDDQKRRTQCYEIIESYLFSKEGEIK